MAKSFIPRWTPLLATLLLASPTLAQDSWVGQTVMPAKLPKEIKFTDVDAKGKEVELEMRLPLYRVVKEKGDRVRLPQGGQAGWVDKDDVVLLREAPKFFTLIITRNPEKLWAWALRGIAHLETGKLDEAINDFSEVIRQAPEDTSSYQYRGMAYLQKKDFDKAIADYGEVIRLDPKDYFSYNLRARAWTEKKDFDKAIADCN
jgi:tetratricopeptide (TPR) repeat protein